MTRQADRWKEIPDLVDKLACIFAGISVPGTREGSKFPQTEFIRNLALQANFPTSSLYGSAGRSFKNWKEKNRLPKQIAEYIISITPGLTMEVLKDGTIQQIREIMASDQSQRFRPNVETLYFIESQYRQNRPDLQKWCLEYYNAVRYSPVSSSSKFVFPLITKEEFLPSAPFELNSATEARLLNALSDDRFDDDMFVPSGFSSLLGASRCNTYVEFRNQYSLEVLKKPRGPFSGFSYRLSDISIDGNLPKFSFARSRYFGYINTCEARAFGAAFHHWGLRSKTQEMNGSPVSLRESASSVYDLQNRNAIVGVNVITLVRDSEIKQARYYRHYRENVDEAIGTHHIVPAGTFQPTTTSADRSWTDVNFEEGFSLLETIRREFIEEVLGKQRRIAEAKDKGEDWRENIHLSAVYDDFRRAEETGRVRMWFLGLGFDPCTEKPELLVALVVDRGWHDRLKISWDEGSAHSELFDPESINAEMASANSWLSAGAACLWLAVHHEQCLLSDAVPRKGKA